MSDGSAQGCCGGAPEGDAGGVCAGGAGAGDGWPAWCDRLLGREGVAGGGALSAWLGTKRLHMEPPPAPHFDSDSSVRVRRVGGSRFLQCAYTWSHEGRAHEGVLLIGVRKKDGAATGAWVDSWHQSGEPMMLRGSWDATAGKISVCGTFSAPPDPDWGWRISLEMPDADRLAMLMYVATPAGEEALAVRATYGREA